MSGASVLPELMTQPGWLFKDDVQHAPMARAFNPTAELPPSIFDAFRQPGFELRRTRFNAAMVAQQLLDSPRSLLDGASALAQHTSRAQT
jgi:hypothetical protein